MAPAAFLTPMMAPMRAPFRLAVSPVCLHTATRAVGPTSEALSKALCRKVFLGHSRLALPAAAAAPRFLSSVRPRASAGPAEQQSAATTERTSVEELRKLVNAGQLESVRVGDVEILLLGTAHISKDSADEARAMVREGRPDAVVVEVCGTRAEKLFTRQLGQQTPLFKTYEKVLENGPAALVEVYLSSMYEATSLALKLQPGGEFSAALEEAARLGIPVVFGDRDQAVTARALAATLFRRTRPLLGALAGAVLLGDWLAGFDARLLSLEALFLLAVPAIAHTVPRALGAGVKEEDVAEIMAEFKRRGASGEGAGALTAQLGSAVIDERDAYLAWAAAAHPRLPPAPRRVLAVVGMGHLPGMRRLLESGEALRVDAGALNTLPDASPAEREKHRAEVAEAERRAYAILEGRRPAAP
eukprot:tig00001415_g8670.t1